MSITVKATQMGYYGMQRRREGEVFDIEDEGHFSKRWMKKVMRKKDEVSEADPPAKHGRAKGTSHGPNPSKRASDESRI